MLQQITKKVHAGERITGEEGFWLMQEAELLDLAPLAEILRQRHNPNKDVTYVVDTNLNYTNLCDAFCSFCAFYRTDPNDPCFIEVIQRIFTHIRDVPGDVLLAELCISSDTLKLFDVN